MTVEGAFEYDGGSVAPGERRNLRYRISETYLGDPVRIPVTVINGERSGPTVFLSAAAHGDELNGIEVVREVAFEWHLTDLAGTVVCLPVLNVPGFLTQQRYLPIYDRDLNRSFPGDPSSTSAKRMAHRIFHDFVEPCDFGVDFHTSTRGRTNMLHVRADTGREEVARLAHAFGASVIVDGAGSDGTLRGEATRAGVPTITVEMGEAHRFERDLIDDALEGVRSVFAEFGLQDRDADGGDREGVDPGRGWGTGGPTPRARRLGPRGGPALHHHRPVQSRRHVGRGSLHRRVARCPREPGGVSGEPRLPPRRTGRGDGTDRRGTGRPVTADGRWVGR